jgi:hypothetical protein
MFLTALNRCSITEGNFDYLLEPLRIDTSDQRGGAEAAGDLIPNLNVSQELPAHGCENAARVRLGLAYSQR